MDTNYDHNQQIVLKSPRKTSIIFILVISLVVILSAEYMVKSTLAASLRSNRNKVSLTTSDPVGNHDGSEGNVRFGSCNAFGWAVDPDDAELDVTVRILSDSNVITTTIAGDYREDINPEICPGGTCGFSVWL